MFSIFLFQKPKKTEEIGILTGAYQEKDRLSPSYINLKNPKYIEIDGIYYSHLLITNYYREQTDLLLRQLIDSNMDINISIFYEKQDTYKAIRELTYHIGNVGVDLRENKDNRQDIDIAAFTYQDAKYIRKELQVNNEELYFLYIYINVFTRDIKDLEYLLNKVEGILQSKGMQTKRAFFRQEQSFIATLPLMINPKDIKQSTKRNILTSGIISTYPFISSNIFDPKGVFIGTNLYNQSLIVIDKYDTQKYKNANMCIFGTSGAGKSFYTKLLIFRYRMLGIQQYVIDPEREYTELCKSLGGSYIRLGPTSTTYINVLDIREESIEEENGYLANKISKLIGFFNLLFGEMNEEEKAIIEDTLIKVYKEKGITFDDTTLYKKKENGKRIFKTTEDMPILEDLYILLGKKEKTKIFQTKLIPFIKGSLKFFNQHTNVELNNKLIIADVYELGEENLKYGMYVFTDLFWDRVKKDRKQKKTIYLDEIWRLIGTTSNKEVASFIYKIFKTIRKYGGSSVAITQDISDLFSLENGIYGKSILNNSSIKTFFALEEENIKILEKFIEVSEKEKIEIKSLKRGECVMFVGNNHIISKIEATPIEKEIIGGSEDESRSDSYGKTRIT